MILRPSCVSLKSAPRLAYSLSSRFKHDASEPPDDIVPLDEESKSLFEPKAPNSKLVEWENYDKPRKLVFQELRKISTYEPIYTLEDAARPAHAIGFQTLYRYPYLATQHTDHNYVLRGVLNEDTAIANFPELSDFVIVGAGLFGSATAYYIKRHLNRTGDVVVLDKDPYSPHNTTATCSGLLSAQSKSRDIVRLTTLTKELIRDLKNDIMVTDEDFARIKYRPITHLILWPKEEVESVLKSVDMQIEDGLHTETKLPEELETTFEWLRVKDSDVAIGTHGNQDEALIDPVALRNLYRTLAQAYGANFVLGEGIDFNTCYSRSEQGINPLSVGTLVLKNPVTGELKNLHSSANILCCSHNTPFLEAKAELEDEMRDQIEDLHFLRPRLRMCFSFNSLSVPLINFPVITDTDGTLLLRDDYLGNFKYYLTLEESENFLDDDYERYINSNSEDPYLNLVHTSEYFEVYFNNVIKPRLVKRIPVMEDAKFNVAFSGFENYNSHDGLPIVGSHPHHLRVFMAAGFGSRTTSLGPATAACMAQLTYEADHKLYDITNLYWNRVLFGRRIDEHKTLVK